MSGIARGQTGGLCTHMVNRGNAGAMVFHDEDDYASFVHLLGRWGRRAGCGASPASWAWRAPSASRPPEKGTGKIACPVRRERRRSSAGEILAWQLSLRPVAIGAVVEVTKRLKPLV